ncbi:hypothetical protein A0H81_05334 [Grifola frondosa]|uniref:Uncharacterized protein n=1 Tax=Grifola frondosa TaxID=5627 RepID=A0A1C7MC61_GRIFR|nr:hypothetical protein A0H81_05334 [Grifola frondosa]
MQYDFPIVPLCTPRHVRPRVPLMVSGYALAREELDAYGDRYGLLDDSGPLNLFFVIVDHVAARLPAAKRRIARVRKPGDRLLSTCFVIASNRNSRRRDGVNDRVLIKQLQEILQVQGPPQWYVMATDY